MNSEGEEKYIRKESGINICKYTPNILIKMSEQILNKKLIIIVAFIFVIMGKIRKSDNMSVI